jgi:hypothetical protein
LGARIQIFYCGNRHAILYQTYIKCNKIMMISKMKIDNKKGNNGIGN